ncbi:hypothetical protein PENTCL1PPCAC_18496, partial [Pristionchus entomophagus]
PFFPFLLLLFFEPDFVFVFDPPPSSSSSLPLFFLLLMHQKNCGKPRRITITRTAMTTMNPICVPWSSIIEAVSSLFGSASVGRAAFDLHDAFTFCDLMSEKGTSTVPLEAVHPGLFLARSHVTSSTSLPLSLNQTQFRDHR